MRKSTQEVKIQIFKDGCYLDLWSFPEDTWTPLSFYNVIASRTTGGCKESTFSFLGGLYVLVFWCVQGLVDPQILASNVCQKHNIWKDLAVNLWRVSSYQSHERDSNTLGFAIFMWHNLWPYIRCPCHMQLMLILEQWFISCILWDRKPVWKL